MAAQHFVWNVDPQVFSFSPLPRWYGLFFVVGFLIGYPMVRKMFAREGRSDDELDRLLLYVIFGTVIGMRLAHTLLYEPETYLREPLRILAFWEGGYASHGGFFGVILALAFFAYRHPQTPFLWIADRVSIPTIMTAGFIRLGNFFNSEIIGRPADVPWAVIFPRYVDALPRHPTQLYEAFGYFCTFAIGWTLYRWTNIVSRPGRLFGVMMILGFGWRFFVEFFKENQVAFEDTMTFNMGQMLSLPFVAVGVALALGVLKSRQAPIGTSRFT